ncbi:hypothetical protein LINPERPRIM_LOCUS20991, partial [Linum perenne]
GFRRKLQKKSAEHHKKKFSPKTLHINITGESVDGSSILQRSFRRKFLKFSPKNPGKFGRLRIKCQT